MRNYAKYFLLGIIVSIILIIFYGYHQYLSSLWVVEFDSVDVKLDVADDVVERRIGLMNRESMDEKRGMIFVYFEPQVLNFWMKNTLIPLDMLWVDENNVVKHIEYAVPCDEDPCKLYSWPGSVKYLIELNGGFTEKYDINIGDKVKINRN